MSRTLAWLGCSVSLASFALGCATANSFTAEVTLPGPLGGTCLMAALDSEPDVDDLVRTSQDAVAFRIALPGVPPKHRPAFALVEERDLDGSPLLTLSTRYETGPFEHDPSPALSRASALVADVAESCTGHRPILGDTLPCGDDVADLCVRGR